MLNSTKRRAAAGLAIAALIVGCGGGGDSPAPAPAPTPAPTPKVSAEGFWQGTSSTGYSVVGVVLENGEYWFIYSLNNFISGVVQGSGQSSNGSFTSTNAVDLNVDGSILAGSVSGSYRVNQSFSGTGSGTGGSFTFSLTYDPSYDRPASQSAVAGTWAARISPTQTLSVTVGSNGVLTGSFNGCSLSGSFTPRPSGKNVYQVTYTLGSAPCVLPGTTFSGVGVFTTNPTGGQRIVTATANAARNGALMFVLDR
jgi:hypothetical protein